MNSDDVRALAEAYGLTTERVEALARLAREAKKPRWWHTYADSLATDGDDFLEIETDAIRACNFESDVIPGLLQTEDYARAVIRRPRADRGRRRGAADAAVASRRSDLASGSHIPSTAAGGRRAHRNEHPVRLLLICRRRWRGGAVAIDHLAGAALKAGTFDR